MISSIHNNHIAQNTAMVNRNNNVSSKSKAAEEANESPSERIAEAKGQSSKSASNHIIDSYA